MVPYKAVMVCSVRSKYLASKTIAPRGSKIISTYCCVQPSKPISRHTQANTQTHTDTHTHSDTEREDHTPVHKMAPG